MTNIVMTESFELTLRCLFIIDFSFVLIFLHFPSNFPCIKICVSSPSFSPIFFISHNKMPIIASFPFPIPLSISIAINKSQLMRNIVFSQHLALNMCLMTLVLVFLYYPFLYENFTWAYYTPGILQRNQVHHS